MQRNTNHNPDNTAPQESRQETTTGAPRDPGHLHEVLYYPPPGHGPRPGGGEEEDSARELTRLRRENQGLNLEVLHLERRIRLILDIIRSDPHLEEHYLQQLQALTESRRENAESGRMMG